jgi:hypothetical protein
MQFRLMLALGLAGVLAADASAFGGRRKGGCGGGHAVASSGCSGSYASAGCNSGCSGGYASTGFISTSPASNCAECQQAGFAFQQFPQSFQQPAIAGWQPNWQQPIQFPAAQPTITLPPSSSTTPGQSSAIPATGAAPAIQQGQPMPQQQQQGQTLTFQGYALINGQLVPIYK